MEIVISIERVMVVDFCPLCEKVLLPDSSKHKLRCRACGYEKPLKEIMLFTEDILKPKPTLVIEVRRSTRKRKCPKCGNGKAYSWRSGRSKENSPEPSNEFFKCLKCGHVWKEMQ